MIINAVFAILNFVLTMVLSVIDVTENIFPQDMLDFLQTMMQSSLLLDPIIPVRTLFLLVVSVISLEALIATYKVMFWAYEQVRKITRSA